MQTPFQGAVNMASLLQRKQTQMLREDGIAKVAEWMSISAANIAAAAFTGPLAIAAGLIGEGWRSVGQQVVNSLNKRAKQGRLQHDTYGSGSTAEVAKWTAMYAPAPVGFAAYLASLVTRVEEECFPILARDWTSDAARAWDAAAARVVS